MDLGSLQSSRRTQISCMACNLWLVIWLISCMACNLSSIAAPFCAALKAEAPAVFARIPARAWRREWVSSCKHYGRGNDAVLSYLSRYVFRTAISNARILEIDRTHVTFRW